MKPFKDNAESGMRNPCQRELAGKPAAGSPKGETRGSERGNAECDSSRAPRGIRTRSGRIPNSKFLIPDFPPSALLRSAPVVPPAPNIRPVPFAQSAPARVFRIPHFLVFLLCSTTVPAATESLLFPDARQVFEVRSNERNPFIQQIAEPSGATSPQEGVSEEARLRRILKAVKIGGVSGKSGHRQLLLGSLILKPGVVLPPLLSNQAEVLRVVSVDASSLTIEFVEKDPAADARKIFVPFDLKPEVTQFLYGEAVEELAQIGPQGQPKMPPLTAGGVTEILKGSQDAELRNIADRDVKLMGVVQDEQAPKKDQ